VTPLVIWFGVLLAVNMQTSFMHPPFGFALMFLRSVAPAERYLDRVTGKETEPVTTGQIYWGAVPFLCIQLAMVAALIAIPSLVISRPDAEREGGAATYDGASTAGRGLTLPGTPPPLDGLRPLPPGTPLGPTLDVSVPPPIR
jgi:hypothetical protein